MSTVILDAAKARRKKVQSKLDTLLDGPRVAGRDLTDPESRKFEKLAKEARSLDTEIDLRTAEEKRAGAGARAAKLYAGDSVVRDEPGVYRKDAWTVKGEASYLRDLAAWQVNGANLGDREEARARLSQNWQEIQRDAQQGKRKALARRIVEEVRRWTPELEARVNPNTSLTTGGEFVPPLWLVSQYVPLARAGRVIANRCLNMPLPPGIDVINIPRITTGTLTAIQVANAAPVATRDIITSTVSASVRTIAGQEDISLQLLEQSPLALDGVVFGDLTRDLDLQTDTQVISGSGANGQHQGVLTLAGATSNTNITLTNYFNCSSTVFHDGSTAATQFRSIVNAAMTVEVLRYQPATAIWVHPRRVASWQFQSDTQTRPLFIARDSQLVNALGLSTVGVNAEGVCGSLYGIDVIKDANMPTNATTAQGYTSGGTGDVIAVVKENDLMLWSGTLRLRALPAILSGTLQVRYQAYQYQAFLPSRFPQSISTITGAGTAAPTF